MLQLFAVEGERSLITRCKTSLLLIECILAKSVHFDFINSSRTKKILHMCDEDVR